MIVCVAVIGKQNNPLFLRVLVGAEDPLRYHYIVHTALDLIEEKTPVEKDTFLGLLFPTENYRIYGFLSLTKTKFIAVVEDSSPLGDQDLRKFFTSLHRHYVDAVCNPFYTYDGRMESRAFADAVEACVRECSRS